MNAGCDRLRDHRRRRRPTPARWSSATTASSGEIVNIMISTPTMQEQRREHLAHRLLQALRDVVDVVRDPAEQVAARLPVDVAERQPVAC